jgi:hypothetical protein
MKDYYLDSNKDFSKSHLEEYRALLSKHIVSIREATLKEDCREATDLILESIEHALKIGVRTFREKYNSKNKPYRNFTLRALTRFRRKTELDKWKEGIYPDYYIVGWDKDGVLIAHIIMDVHSFIKNGGLDLICEKGIIKNADGTGFVKMSVEDLYNLDCLVEFDGIIIPDKEETLDLFSEESEENSLFTYSLLYMDNL